MDLAPWITFVIAAWLISSPFVIAYRHVYAALANDVIAGLLIILCSLVVAVTGSRAASWVLAFLGLWVVAAPFLLGYYRNIPSTNSTMNEVLTGAVIFLTAAIHAVAARHSMES